MNVSQELRAAIIRTLDADNIVKGLVTAIYDDVPPTAQMPYVSWGPEQFLNDDSDCIEGFQVTLQIDVWTREIGYGKCSQITQAIRDSLHHRLITLSNNALVDIEVEQMQHLRDQDNRIRHGIVTMTAFVELE
jgi:hypothetical protein